MGLNFKIEEELLCCFNVKDIKHFHTGKISPYIFPKKRSEVYNKKIPHLIVRLFAKSTDGKYLIQKRSLKKDSNKGKWTDSASGHVVYDGDLTYEMIEKNMERELTEEMGVKLNAIRFYKMFLDENSDNQLEFNYIYIGLVEENLKLNLEEVDRLSNFYEESELNDILLKKNCVEISKTIWAEIINKNADYLFYNMQREMGGEDEFPVKKGSKKIGLIIGRFQPLHKGHLYLIKESLKFVSKVKIGIGSSQFSDLPKNPFSYEERKNLIRTSLNEEGILSNQFEIYPIPDQFNLIKWLSKVLSVIGHFDVIFTNSLWIGRLFQQKNKDMIYGLKFDFTTYNGTKIRSLIFNDQPEWLELVPKSIVKYINKPDVSVRMKKLRNDI